MAAPFRHRAQRTIDAAEMHTGGDVCESNTPGTLFTPHTGFEDQGPHQEPSASILGILPTVPVRVKPAEERVDALAASNNGKKPSSGGDRKGPRCARTGTANGT